MKGIFHIVYDDSMASVGTTSGASKKIIVCGEEVNEFSFSLITPLGTEDDDSITWETHDGVAFVDQVCGERYLWTGRTDDVTRGNAECLECLDSAKRAKHCMRCLIGESWISFSVKNTK